MLALVLQLCEGEVVEVTHEASRDGVAPTTRRTHGTDEVDIHQMAEVT